MRRRKRKVERTMRRGRRTNRASGCCGPGSWPSGGSYSANRGWRSVNISEMELNRAPEGFGLASVIKQANNIRNGGGGGKIEKCLWEEEE
jgi:hypothetical protein